MTENSPNSFGAACFRSAHARTQAAMGAIVALRHELAAEKGDETALSSSAYQNIKNILLDLFDGAYQQGYGAGEDQAHMRINEEK